MSRGFLIILGMTIGSVAGGYVPMLWGDSFLSFTSILTSGVGSIIGIWIMYKITA
jgi:uncharacterized membrane protein YeaQ/YmgE (transglycosylase-associated protein family)